MIKVGLFILYDAEIDSDAALLMCTEAAAKFQALARDNQREVEVEPHAVLRTQEHYYRGMMKKDTEAYCKANGLTFDRRCVWAQTTHGSVARGWGELYPGWSIVYGGQSMTNSVGTMFHEALGHNDGLNHAATTDGTDIKNTGDDYRMGGGNSRWNYSAFEKVSLGLLPRPRQVLTSESVRLVPTHTNPLAMHPDEERFVVCEDADGAEWGISIPPTIGHPDGLEGFKHQDKYHVHKKVRASYRYQFIREIPSRDFNTSVRFSDTVTITVLPRHDELVDIPDTFDPGIEHSGPWADPDVSGQGIHLIVRRSGLQVAWYTFDAFGNQDWYMAFTEGRDKFRILRMSDASDVGEGRIRMLANDRLVFQFNTTRHGHNCFEYSPVIHSVYDERSGAYRFNEDLSEKGFTWHFFQMFWIPTGRIESVVVGWWFEQGLWQMHLGIRQPDSDDYLLSGIQPDGNVFAGHSIVEEHPLGNFTLTDNAGALSFNGRKLLRIWS